MNVARLSIALAAAALVAPMPGRAQQLPPPVPAAQPSAQDLVLARSNILPNLGFNASVGGFRVGAGSEERIDPSTGLPIPIRASQSDNSYSAGLILRQLV